MEDVAHEIGVGAGTLERWRSDVLSRPAREGEGQVLQSSIPAQRSSLCPDLCALKLLVGSITSPHAVTGARRFTATISEVPPAQPRPLATALVDFARRYPDRREAMARGFQTGVYSMQEIADAFGVHYATVVRAVRRLDGGKGLRTTSLADPDMLDCKTPQA